DYFVAEHDRRTRETPKRNLRARFSRNVVRPHHRAGACIECIQDSGRAECINSAAAECRRCARSGATVRLEEARAVAMRPDGLRRTQVVTDDFFVFAALFLCVKEVAIHGERRPAWTNWMFPQLHRGRRGPVSFYLHAAHDTIASGSTKARPLSASFSSCC